MSIRMGFDGDTWWQGTVFDGELFLRDGDTEGDGGLITVDGDKLTLTNGSGVWFTYSWSVEGDRLTLALLECVPQSGAGNCEDDIADVEFMTERTYTFSGSDPTLPASTKPRRPAWPTRPQ